MRAAIALLAFSAVPAASCAPPGPGAAPPEARPGPAVQVSYLGGSRTDPIRDVAFDAEGNLYLAGGTESPDYPLPLRMEGPGGGMDVVVAKLDTRGRPVWARGLGGPGHDRAYGVEVGPDGSVWVAGRAGPRFPVSEGAFQTRFMGGEEASFYGPQDGFVCRLTAAGETVFCSYFGTSDPRPIRDVAVGPGGEVYIASGTSSGRYPPGVEAVFRNRRPGGEDAVAARIAPDGSRLLWATFLGGTGWEGHENTVRVDGEGNPYVLFTTGSEGIATEGVWDTEFGGALDVFVARLDADDGSLRWGTYIGGPGDESTETHEMAVDPAGQALVAVPTKSERLPTTQPDGLTPRPGGLNDVYVVRLSPRGRLLAATLLGGEGNDRAEGVAADRCGNVYLTGTTTSSSFPLTADAYQRAPDGGRDAFVTVLPPRLDVPLYSTRLGGNDEDYGRSAAATPAGERFAVAVATDSTRWPLLDSLQPGYGGGEDDAVFARFETAGFCPAGAEARPE